LAIGTTIAYPVAVSGVDELRTKHGLPLDTCFLSFSVFVGLIVIFDFPERIRRSSHLSHQVMLLYSLTMFLYFVFRLLPLVLEYPVEGRLTILGVVVALVSWSILGATRHMTRTLRESHLEGAAKIQ
jgi:hypothetical protein